MYSQQRTSFGAEGKTEVSQKALGDIVDKATKDGTSPLFMSVITQFDGQFSKLIDVRF